jgi:glycosyltransferase involved in cell wall biosynthesis
MIDQGQSMRISIVMPTYNGMKYLKQAVDSVLAQRYQDWELLISDDGSVDGTRNFLSELTDPRITVFLQKENLGIFGNLNFLFSKVSCELTQFLCQDDYFSDEGSLHRLLEQWAGLSSEIAFLRCNHHRDSNSSHSRFEAPVLPPIVAPEQSDLFFFIFGCIPGNLSNVSVRTETVRRAGWFRVDMPYAGDFEFWSRVGRSYPWAISRTNVAVIRDHPEQASKFLNKHGELFPQMRRILETLYSNLIHKGYPSNLLRLEVTINHISQHRSTGIKLLLKGKGLAYLREVSTQLDSSPAALGTAIGWMVCFVTLGGRVFLNVVSKKLLKFSCPASIIQS